MQTEMIVIFQVGINSCTFKDNNKMICRCVCTASNICICVCTANNICICVCTASMCLYCK